MDNDFGVSFRCRVTPVVAHESPWLVSLEGSLFGSNTKAWAISGNMAIPSPLSTQAISTLEIPDTQKGYSYYSSYWFSGFRIIVKKTSGSEMSDEFRRQHSKEPATTKKASCVRFCVVLVVGQISKVKTQHPSLFPPVRVTLLL